MAKITVTPLGFPWATQDPFLFCAYHKDAYPKGNNRMGIDTSQLQGRAIGSDFVIKDGWRMYHGKGVPGFPYHPHRGFETITICKEGVVDHSDSLGAAGRFGKGDVQWMTAGKGILHSEMFPLINRDSDNPLEMFQVWLNLPKASKFVEPHFRMLWNDTIPVIVEENKEGKKVTVDVIAGHYNDTTAPDPTPDSWAANPHHHVAVWTIKMDADATWEMPAVVDGLNRSLFYYDGDSIDIDGQKVSANHCIAIEESGTVSITNGSQDSFFLMLQGRPINEPVAQHGPFVMNTQQEIQEAFEEYRQTQFGGWPWPMQEQVHAREKGRFALHADGVEEVK